MEEAPSPSQPPVAQLEHDAANPGDIRDVGSWALPFKNKLILPSFLNLFIFPIFNQIFFIVSVL